MSENLTHEESIHKLAELIKDIDIAMLTTVEGDGSLRSRPMSTQKTEFDGTLWFFIEKGSAKVREIEHNSHVNLSYSDTKNQTYVSVSGRARTSDDRAKIDELWNPMHKIWFPEGKDDPTLTLLAVEVDHAEYWDAPSGVVVNVLGFAKAVATGQRYEPGENKKVDL
jgi:general stress protein 26